MSTIKKREELKKLRWKAAQFDATEKRRRSAAFAAEWNERLSLHFQNLNYEYWPVALKQEFDKMKERGWTPEVLSYQETLPR